MLRNCRAQWSDLWVGRWEPALLGKDFVVILNQDALRRAGSYRPIGGFPVVLSNYKTDDRHGFPSPVASGPPGECGFDCVLRLAYASGFLAISFHNVQILNLRRALAAERLFPLAPDFKSGVSSQPKNPSRGEAVKKTDSSIC